MRFRIDHEDHRTGAEHAGTDEVDCRDIVQAERESLKSLCQEAADAGNPHVAATITLRNERGKPLSVVSVHATVKRL